MKFTRIKNIILFFSLILLVDFLGGKILNKQFPEISFGRYGAINNSLKSSSEILILGSSRAMHHYNADIFFNKLKLSCYNAGLGGFGLFLNYAILNERIKKDIPKIVILDLSPNVIEYQKSFDKLNVLMPYYKGYSSFREIIKLDPEFSNFELISNLYIYNSVYYDLVRGSFSKVEGMMNGFVPLDTNIDLINFKPFELFENKIDENKINYLNKIIQLCKKHNIELMGIVSPTFVKFDKSNIFINELKNIFENNDVIFLDYSDFSKIYNRPEYFKDQLHLNSSGADFFSRELSNRINLKNGI